MKLILIREILKKVKKYTIVFEMKSNLYMSTTKKFQYTKIKKHAKQLTINNCITYSSLTSNSSRNIYYTVSI